MKLFKLILLLIVFSNWLNASEANPTEEEVSKLYVATFNRAADSAGLDYWINSGLKLSEIAQSFFDQEETRATYPNGTTNRAFIRSVYLNLFNREPEDSGWDYWEAELDALKISKNRFIEAVINGAKDDDNGQDATILLNKNEVGLAFAAAGFGNNDFPSEIMSGITENRQTVSFILSKISSNSIDSKVWDTFDPDSYSYIGSWTGKTHVYLSDNVNVYCKWDFTMDITSEDDAKISAFLTSHNNDQGDCDSFSNVEGKITNKSNAGFIFNVIKTSSAFIYGGDTFIMTRDGNTLDENVNISLYGFSAKRLTTLEKQ